MTDCCSSFVQRHRSDVIPVNADQHRVFVVVCQMSYGGCMKDTISHPEGWSLATVQGNALSKETSFFAEIIVIGV